MKMHPMVKQMFECYREAARSGAGLGMLIVAVVLSLWGWAERGMALAVLSGGVLYVLLLTTLVAGRWRSR